MMSEVLFARIARHQRVEVGNLAARLGTQNPAQSLRFFLARTERPGNLNEHIGVGQVQGEVADLGKDELPYFAGAELAVQLFPLGARRLAGDKRDIEAFAELAKLLEVLADNQHPAVAVAVQQL